jgi:hypothetical protein
MLATALLAIGATIAAETARAEDCVIGESLTRAQKETCLKKAIIWDDAWKPEDAIRYPFRKGDPAHPAYQLHDDGSVVKVEGKFDPFDKLDKGGRTSKFDMRLISVDGHPAQPDAKGDLPKERIKYSDQEARGCVAGSRLQHALGMAGVDDCYFVEAIVHNSPACPWCQHTNQGLGTQAQESVNYQTRHFPAEKKPGPPGSASERVVAQKKIKAERIETAVVTEEGVGFGDLDRVSDRPRAERDAVKLFAAFINHVDNKAAQQRVVCPKKFNGQDNIQKRDGQEVCLQPVYYVHDVGRIFGVKTSNPLRALDAPDLPKWINERMWEPAAPACTASLHPIRKGSLRNPRISEEGRQFFLARMNGVVPKRADGTRDDTQIRELYRGAEFDTYRLTATEDEFVRGFLHRLGEIEKVTCPTGEEIDRGIAKATVKKDRLPASKPGTKAKQK